MVEIEPGSEGVSVAAAAGAGPRPEPSVEKGKGPKKTRGEGGKKPKAEPKSDHCASDKMAPLKERKVETVEDKSEKQVEEGGGQPCKADLANNPLSPEVIELRNGVLALLPANLKPRDRVFANDHMLAIFAWLKDVAKLDGIAGIFLEIDEGDRLKLFRVLWHQLMWKGTSTLVPLFSEKKHDDLFPMSIHWSAWKVFELYCQTYYDEERTGLFRQYWPEPKRKATGPHDVDVPAFKLWFRVYDGEVLDLNKLLDADPTLPRRLPPQGELGQWSSPGEPAEANPEIQETAEHIRKAAKAEEPNEGGAMEATARDETRSCISAVVAQEDSPRPNLVSGPTSMTSEAKRAAVPQATDGAKGNATIISRVVVEGRSDPAAFRPKTHTLWFVPVAERQRIWDKYGMPKKIQAGCNPFELRLPAGPDWMAKLQVHGIEIMLPQTTPVNRDIAFYLLSQPDRILVTLRWKLDGEVPEKEAILLLHYWDLLMGWAETVCWEGGPKEFRHIGTSELPFESPGNVATVAVFTTFQEAEEKHLQKEAEEKKRQEEQKKARLAKAEKAMHEAKMELQRMTHAHRPEDRAATIECIKSWVQTSAADSELLDVVDLRNAGSQFALFLSITESLWADGEE